MTLGENIKKLREMNNLTQKQLADGLGYSFQNISKWENGTSMPDIPTVVSIAKYFNISLDVLLDNSPSTQSLTITADINGGWPYVIWTDFEHMGTVAPKARTVEDRHRTGATETFSVCDSWDYFAMGINADGVICFIKAGRNGNTGVRDYYFLPGGEEDCICPKDGNINNYWNWRSTDFEICLPKGGYIIAGDFNDKRTADILRFVIPAKLHDFIDPTNYNCNLLRIATCNMSKHLFSVLPRGELSGISVTLSGNSVTFTKKTEYINPLEVNIDQVTAMVKESMQKTLRNMQDAIDELISRVDDLESNDYDDLDSRIEELENAIDGLKSQIDDND